MKTSNMFFPAGGSVNPIVFDFQWAGWGPHGFSDVVYFLYGGVEYDALVALGEFGWRDYYLEAKAKMCRRSRGGADRSDFDASLVVYWAIAMSVLLKGLSPSLCLENRAKYGWLTIEKDPRVALLFTSHALAACGRLRAAC